MATDKRLLWLLVSAQLPLSASSFPFSLSLSVYLLFLQSTHSLKLISHEPLLIVWSQSRHAGTMATGGVYTASECKFATFDDTSRMKGLSVCMCALNSSDLYLWIKAMRVRNRFIYPVKLYEQYCIQKMRNHNRFRTLTCQFIRIPSNLVSGLSVNGGFMRSVCLHSSVSSTKPPWGVEDTLAGVILVNQNNLFWQTWRDVWQWGVNFHWKSRLNGSLALFHPMFYIYFNSLSSWNSFVSLTNRLNSVRDLMTHRITPVHLLHSLQCTPTSITYTGS